MRSLKSRKRIWIVAQAGRLGAVTIATNMAGRGTDIILGAIVNMARLKMKEVLLPRLVKPEDKQSNLFQSRNPPASQISRDLPLKTSFGNCFIHEISEDTDHLQVN